ncbi:DUF6146 family protein [Polaribacter sp.]|nr:DUF6146 family protein [Polaribacter sp.]MDB4241512.1 DUF6146 family protein [Polaribacter sp.]
MKLLKQLFAILIVGFLFYACGSQSIEIKKNQKEPPVRITNDSLAYEIIIIDPGFTAYLNTIAQPEGFYNQSYLEARNRVWVSIWNQRVQNTPQFRQDVYENNIAYLPTVDYGYEVNYKLFNYFLFAQRKYKMTLGGGFRANRIN